MVLCALALMGLVARPSEGRLRPYYVVQGIGNVQAKPQILFVLDTSGSMAMRTRAGESDCRFSRCEDGTGTHRSRIATARDAIRTVIESTGDSASFALMTFDQLGTPRGGVPRKCGHGADARRFRFATRYRRGWAWWDRWMNATQHGHTGVWELCDGNRNRPYPYLRWDNLGVGATVSADDQTGPVPPSPLIGTSQAQFGHASNAQRGVQWFPKFMGVRVNLNTETDPGRRVLHGTIGDYGTSVVERNAEVWEQDFYYWPYVDGFVGYSAHDSRAGHKLGYAEEDSSASAAALYAPFYFDLSKTGLDAKFWGPADEEEARAGVLSHVSPLIEGGVDSDGPTPWRSVIGPIPAAPPQNNAVFSHTTVSSYLKFATGAASKGHCAPTATVLITDGEPNRGQGGWRLYQRLADLRNELDVKTYVVGFLRSSGELNEMACAAAGACDGAQCRTPCNDSPAQEWDTCAHPDAHEYDGGNPDSGCAYLADSADTLAGVLTEIVTQAIELDVPTGPVATLNDFGIGVDGDALAQTRIRAWTQVPAWKGHVTRDACDERDEHGVLLPHCELPSPEFDFDEVEETFGPCPQSRSWDAGECLQATAWSDRRVYTHTASNKVIAVAEDDGTATPAFRDELLAQDLIDAADADDEADAIAAFILGRDFPDDWKLPGLASAAPIAVRRIPKPVNKAIPEVNVRDPHCGGRRLGSEAQGALPDSLLDFASDAWDEDVGIVAAPSPHYEYQEAVLVGDDVGVLHAFQLDSGNELWGLLPRFALAGAVEQARIGAGTRGQPAEIEEHKYGIAATVNAGWVYDDSAPDEADHTWRHVAVVGMGAGGSEYIALDVSHMSPESPRGPIEILWTTEDSGLADAYDELLGETWARPALTYHVPGDVMSNEPDAFLVMGSGYPVDDGASEQGRALLRVDAATGAILETAELPAPTNTLYDDEFGTLVDPSVGTHCISRFFAEAQETYVADPSGRLFRWDLGRTTNHAADSGEIWDAQALPLASFTACQGRGDTCTVRAGGAGDPFLFAPAVSANDRIDDTSSVTGDIPEGIDQFLVALVSGAPSDDSLDRSEPADDFHSSLYLLVDDHRADGHTGLSVPDGAPKMSPADVGSYAGYLRIALSDIERTREVIPYEGSPGFTDTGTFSPATRPVRAPTITVSGVLDGSDPDDPTVVDDVEVYTIAYYVYEPPAAECNPEFYNPATGEWALDLGSTYEVTFRLTADAVGGFDFTTGSTSSALDFADGFERGLVFESVSQKNVSGCDNGNCGPRYEAAAMTPCGEMAGGGGEGEQVRMTIPLTTKALRGFTAIE